MTLPGIDTIVGLLRVVLRSKEESALLDLAAAADEMLQDIEARPSVVKFWGALHAVAAIEAAKAPAQPNPPPITPEDPPAQVGGHPHGTDSGRMPPGM